MHFDSVQVVVPTPIQLADPVEAILDFKKRRAAELVHWKELYAQAASQEVDFDRIVEWIHDTILTTEREAELTAAAYNAYLGATQDPHTYIIPMDYMMALQNSTGEQYFGIGAQIKKVGVTVLIIEAFEGSPALAAGLRARDVVTHVDDFPVNDLTIEQVVKRIKGPEGTPVVLTVQRPEATVAITIIRGRIVFPNVAHKTIERHDQRLGYIRLGSFTPTTSCLKIKAAIAGLSADHVRGLILDLRGNSGGLLNQAVCIVSQFLASGKIVVQLKDLEGNIIDTNKTSGWSHTDLPLVVLQDAGSASASEVVAGALQEYERSYTVGERSFGKGSVQRMQQVAAKILMAKTQGLFHFASGRTNQIVGITPDLEAYRIPDPTEAEKVAFREEDRYINPIPPTNSEFVHPNPAALQTLRSCVADTGDAEVLFAAQENSPQRRDYALLVAGDVLHCVLRHNLHASAASR